MECFCEAWNVTDMIKDLLGNNGYCKLGTRTWNDSSELLLSSNSQVSPSCRLFSLQMSTQPVMKPLNLGVHWYSTGQSLMHGSLSITTFLPCFFVLGITGSRVGSSCTEIFQSCSTECGKLISVEEMVRATYKPCLLRCSHSNAKLAGACCKRKNTTRFGGSTADAFRVIFCTLYQNLWKKLYFN